MSDRFYSFVRAFGWHIFWLSSRPVVIGKEHVQREGAFIVGATHESLFDIAMIIGHSKRLIDPLAAAEFVGRPLPRWFLRGMNCVFLNRTRSDTGAVLEVIKRLEHGRAVAIFPEGRVIRGEESVIRTGRIHSGIGRISKITQAPIVPCVVSGAFAYNKVCAWLPLGAVRYGIIFGSAIFPEGDAGKIEGKLIDEWVRLHGVLRDAMGEKKDEAC
jgi:1-acyl-sn-glycerol-3-phosphate acyltransferase